MHAWVCHIDEVSLLLRQTGLRLSYLSYKSYQLKNYYRYAQYCMAAGHDVMHCTLSGHTILHDLALAN